MLLLCRGTLPAQPGPGWVGSSQWGSFSMRLRRQCTAAAMAHHRRSFMENAPHWPDPNHPGPRSYRASAQEQHVPGPCLPVHCKTMLVTNTGLGRVRFHCTLCGGARAGAATRLPPQPVSHLCGRAGMWHAPLKPLYKPTYIWDIPPASPPTPNILHHSQHPTAKPCQ